MTVFTRLRVAALSALLAVSPALPVVASPVQPATDARSMDAYMARLDARPTVSRTGFDAGAINAAFGDAARLTYTAADTDPATGAARLTGLRFEILGDEPLTLFTASEMLVWNADIAALSARFSGQRLGENIRLFDRIELSGVKMDLTDYTNAVDDAVTAAMPEAGTGAANISYEDAEMNIGRVILNGMTLHPWTHETVEGQEEGLAAIRLLSAFARGFSLEAAAFIDSKSIQSMTEGGATGTMETSYPAQIIEGYSRGDIAAMVQSDVVFSGVFPIPSADSAEGSLATSGLFEMSGKLDHGSWNGVRLSKLLEYGERGEMPPISERDLWSFGTYALAGMSFDFGGQPVMQIGRLDISADQFAWFLPERIAVKHEDVSFDMAALMSWAAELEPETMTPTPGEPSLAEIIGIMERTGLGKLSGDGTFLLSWDSQTGKALIEGNSVSDNLYADDTHFDLRLPSYADIVPAFGVDGRTPNSELLGEIFEEKFAFSGGHYSLTDSGLLDTMAKLAIEFAKISGESDPMLSNFAESTPESVRMFASGMLMFAGGAVSKDVPQATGWINSLSGFITSGGTFTVKLAPERDLTAADLAPDPEAGMVEAPGAGELADLFGVSMTHTPPAPTAAGTP